MIRMLFLLLTLGTALLNTSAQSVHPADDPVKVAEGSYSGTDSWVLWRSADGYRAEIQILWQAPEFKDVRQVETLDLTNRFLMKRFRYETQKVPGLGDGVLDCVVEGRALNCSTAFGRHEGRGRIPLSEGRAHAAQFGVHMAYLDLPWFFATLVANDSRDPSHVSQAWVVPIAFDGKTKDDLITSYNQAKARITYLGRETLTVLGKQVSAHKYSIKALHYDSTVWTAENGLLLAVDWAGMRMELTRFKQYEEFTPELVGALEEAPPKRKPLSFSNLD